MASSAPRSFIGLLKQACNEIPEVVGSTGLGIVGFGLGGYAAYRHWKRDGDNHRYKYNYIVVRPDDPRAARIRKD